MKIKWNKVTWYSKLAAVILALIIFGVGFCLGADYGQIASMGASQSPASSAAY